MHKLKVMLLGTVLAGSLWAGSGVAHAAPDGDASTHPSAERTPCDPHDWIYAFFSGGYFHCSKDGILTEHHVV